MEDGVFRLRKIKPVKPTMAGKNTLKVLDFSLVSPAPGATTITVGETSSYPLSFFDLQWITSPPVQQLCFYEHSNNNNPKSDFNQTIVPNLKHSLSITLGHFLPLSGNLVVFPYDSGKKPEIRYVEGDSVSLLVTECTKHFTNLIGNHARNADEFYPLAPHLGQVSKDESSVKVPLLAVQVTLFPDSGICIGITTHHAACDGNARVRFLKAWASIAKFGGDDKSFVESGSIPFLDRSVIKDPYHQEEKIWSKLGQYAFESPQPRHLSGPTDKVRATFLMTRTQINKLKEVILLRRPRLAHVSTFTIVYAHVWTCMARVRAADGDDKGEKELEQVLFTADFRARLDPPIPATYFGNCVGALFAKATRSQFLGEDGFLNAVQVIGDAIYERLSNKENIYGDEEKWKELDLSLRTTLGVAGSPKFNTYDMDFGWGKPRKCEIISIDHFGSMSLSVSKDSEEDIEVGLSLSKMQMEAFVTIFNNGLKNT